MSRIALLSNVTTGIIEQFLSDEHEVYVPEGYDTWMMELLNQNSSLYTEPFDAVFVLLHGTECVRGVNLEQKDFSMFEQWNGAIENFASKVPETTVFVSNIDIEPEKLLPVASRRYESEFEFKWYDMIQKTAEELNNVYVFDMKRIISDLGRNVFYSKKMWYMGSIPFSLDGSKAIVEDIKIILKALSGKKQKCLALDLDNTLWGGVIGEDGLDGILLSENKEGSVYYDLQCRAKEIKEMGPILAIVSKNNLEDALEPFEKHPHMALRLEDIAAKKINWDGKPTNVEELASELNIGIDSFVFFDDNPMEQEMMKEQQPKVKVAVFPRDVTQLSKAMEDVYRQYFFTLRTTAEDLKKTEMYQQEQQRTEIKKSVKSVGEYIKTLEIDIDIHRVTETEKERVAQLCNKTNQFNLTTKRYALKDIEEFSRSEDKEIFTLHTKDKFGDNGLVGVMICQKTGEKVLIDTFLMSCRVMGRYIEEAFVNQIAKYYAPDFKELIGIYSKTKKNKPVEELYDRLGFEKVSDDGEVKEYKLSLDNVGDIPDYHHSISFCS